MAIHTGMSAREIDKALRAFLDAASEDNNDKVVYIRDGQLAFEDGEALFDVTPLE